MTKTTETQPAQQTRPAHVPQVSVYSAYLTPAALETIRASAEEARSITILAGAPPVRSEVALVEEVFALREAMSVLAEENNYWRNRVAALETELRLTQDEAARYLARAESYAKEARRASTAGSEAISTNVLLRRLAASLVRGITDAYVEVCAAADQRNGPASRTLHANNARVIIRDLLGSLEE